MKSVTEFPTYKLTQGLEKKKAFEAEGKTPEEVTAALGEAFKLEGDKLKFFVAAMDVASQNLEKLARVLVVSLNEGESAPPKSTKVEDHVYIPDFQQEARKPVMEKVRPGGPGKGGPGGKGKGGPKESPWGLSPEQKAAKKGQQGGAKTGAKPS